MPKPLAALSPSLARKIQWLLTDVDDTLTWQGRLPPETLAALNQLGDAGIYVVAVTGACAGWCDHIAKLWPVHGVIGENGAFWMQKTQQGFLTHSLEPLEIMRAQQQKLMLLLDDILTCYPGVEFADDQGFRFCDVAINLGQHREPVPDEVVTGLLEKVRGLTLEGRAVQATQSSIHMNVWVGEHSKRLTSELYLKQNAPFDRLRPENIAYIGDSLNDESMFAWLPLTFGVNNLIPLLAQLKAKPAYVTERQGGYGFAELADRLLALRSGSV